MSKREKFSRLGIATKGFVYCLIGGLTAMTAFGIGGQTTDSSGVLEYIGSQTFGVILLIVAAAGLAGFVFYRFYQAFVDPEGKGHSAKGLAQRGGYLSSGIFYSFLAFTAIEIVAGAGSGSGGGGGNKTVVAKLLNEPFGQILVGILAVIFLGKAVLQFYRAYSGVFSRKVKHSGLPGKARKLIFRMGRVGYISRGIVIGIISFLIFRAALTASSSEAGDTEDAFKFLQNEFGSIALGAVAVGLIAYGLFMFVKARYREIAV